MSERVEGAGAAVELPETDHTRTVALTLRITEVQHERLRSTSFVLRRPISDLIREAINGHHWHADGIWCEECPTARQGNQVSRPGHPAQPTAAPSAAGGADGGAGRG